MSACLGFDVRNFKSVLFKIILFVVMGSLCGVIGSAFSKSVGFVTAFRENHGWMLFLLPIAGIITVWLCRWLKTEGVGTTEVFSSAENGKPLPLWLFPAVFVSTVLTHLCGGSAGKEGSALQIGGGISALVSKVFKVDEKTRNTLVLSGMAALFSAVFSTPIAAAVFAVEAVRIKKMRIFNVFPCLLSSFLAYAVSLLLKIKPERFRVGTIPEIEFFMILKVLLIAAAAAVVGVIFCQSLHYFHKGFARLISNGYIRIFIGAVIVVLLSVLIGSNDYNGSSAEGITRIFETGKVRFEAFALKLLLTVITMGCGFKGGEIIPSLFIGAALGGAISAVLGLSVPFGAAVGMAALFCSVTKCPFATFFLCLELFGFKTAGFIVLAVLISLICSGKFSLYGDVKPLFKRYV